MKTRAILSKYHGVIKQYFPVSIHPTIAAAHAEVIFRGGRMCAIDEYPNGDTYSIQEVESYE